MNVNSRFSEGWSQYKGLIQPSDIVVRFVRYEYPYGWSLITIQVYNEEEFDVYAKDIDESYLTEKALKDAYPDSLSIKEGFEKGVVKWRRKNRNHS